MIAAPDTSWMDDAACAGVQTAVMFPVVPPGTQATTRRRAEQPALDVCATCTHHDDCHAHWIASGRPVDGIWFGTTPEDRKNRNLTGPRAGRECAWCCEPLSPEACADPRRKYCSDACVHRARVESQRRHQASVVDVWGSGWE